MVDFSQITPNVKFDTIAREWRFKWSPDSEKQSLVEAQNVLESVLKEVKSVKGVKSVQRIVCGGEDEGTCCTALYAPNPIGVEVLYVHLKSTVSIDELRFGTAIFRPFSMHFAILRDGRLSGLQSRYCP